MQLGIDETFEKAISDEWSRLASPGTWLTGQQRVDLAQQARAAHQGTSITTTSLAAPMTEAARLLSADAAAARGPWVQALYDADLDPLEYVEILGVVARLNAIDTFLFGVGHPERPLPTPIAGDPTLQLVDGADFNGAWAPTVGPAGAPSSLTAIDAERVAMFDIHSAFYLSLEQMGQMDIVKDLQRDQLELIAARTSMINDCFY
jgi:hypothetical protein